MTDPVLPFDGETLRDEGDTFDWEPRTHHHKDDPENVCGCRSFPERQGKCRV